MKSDDSFEYIEDELKTIEREAVVLGSILSDKRLHAVVFPEFHEKIFHKEEHKRIYATCSSIYKNGMLIDSGTIIEKLKSNGDLELAGGIDYVLSLTNKAASYKKCIHDINMIQLDYFHREFQRIMTENSRRAEDEKDSQL